MDDLRTASKAVTTDLHQYMKWFKVLSKDYSLAQSEKKKMQQELETALNNISSSSDLEKENNILKQKLEKKTQKEISLVSKIKDLEKTIFTWNQSSTSMNTLIASQRPTTDVTGLGYSEKSLDSNNNNASKTNKGIVFVKSTKAEEIIIPKNNRNHQGSGYVSNKNKVEFKNHRKYKTTWNYKYDYVKCFTCHKYGHKAIHCYHNYDYYVRPKIRQIWVPKGTNIYGPKLHWVPKVKG